MRMWVLRHGDAGARACVVAALFVMPLVFHPATLDQFSLIKLGTLWALGIGAIAFWAAWSSERRRWLPRARIISAASLFVVIAAVATAASEIPQVSVIGLYGRYGGLVPMALYVAIAVVTIAVFRDRPERLQALAWAPVAASPLMAAYVVAQAKGHDFVDWGLNREESARIAVRLAQYPISTMGNSNFVGGYLGIVAPLVAFAFLRARRTLTRTVIAGVALLDLLALWYTRSRGGLVAAAAGLLVVIVLWGPWHRAALRLWASIFAIAVVVASVAVFSHRFDASEGAVATGGILRNDTLVSRTRYWGSAIDIVRDHPALGTGPDTFYANYPPHRRPADGAQFGLVLADEPHNILLDHASNLGLIGVASYLLVVGLTLVYGVRRVPRLAGGERHLLVAFLAMFVAYLAQGMFSIDVPVLAFVGWIAIAAVAVLADPALLRARRREARWRPADEGGTEESTTRRQRRVSRRRSRSAVHVVIALVALPVAALGAVPVLADHEARTAAIGVRQTPPLATSASHASRAVDLDRREATYRSVAGDVAEQSAAATSDPLVKRKLLDEALRRYRQALRMRPGHIYYMINVARVITTEAAELDASRFPEAERAWLRVVDFDRTDWAVHAMYAQMLNARANAEGGDVDVRRRVARELETVVRIRPDDVDSWINLARVSLALRDTRRAESAAQRALALAPGNAQAADVLNTIRRG